MADFDDDAPQGWSGYVVGGLGYSPEFPGSEDLEVTPLMAARLDYGQFYVEMNGPALKINAVPSERFQAGPMIGYDLGRDDAVENEVVKLLPEVDSTFQAGAFATVSFEDAIMPGDSFDIEFTVLKAMNSHEGLVGTVGASYGHAFTPKFFAAVEAEVSYADSKYMVAYYGVDAAGSAASGLSQYSPSSGVSGVEIGANARYMFTENWGVVGRASYERLLGDAADSPIAKMQGSPDQVSVGLGIVFAF